jgi:hypothetical protein
MNISIKAVGNALGTVGWLNSKIKNGELFFTESNSYFYPPYGKSDIAPRTCVHGLVLCYGKKRFLVAYRGVDKYEFDVRNSVYDPIGYGEMLPLSDASIAVVERICTAWIAEQEHKVEDDVDEYKIAISLEKNEDDK